MTRLEPALAFLRRRWPLLALAAVLFFAAVTGTWVVRPDETGVVLRFGRAVRTCPAGFHLTLPWPVETMVRVGTTEVRTMPVGFRLREKLKGRRPSDAEVQWLTGDTNIVEIQATVQYVVRDPADFLFNVSDLADDEPRDFVIRKLAEAVLTSLVAEMGVDDVLSTGKARLAAETGRRLQEETDAIGLGVFIQSVNIVDGSPPAAVIRAFNDVSSAKAERQRLLNEADGYSREILPAARAEAERIEREAEIYQARVVNAAAGAAERFADLAKEVAAAPEVSRTRLWLEAVEGALSRAKLVVYPREPGERFRLTRIENAVRMPALREKPPSPPDSDK